MMKAFSRSLLLFALPHEKSNFKRLADQMRSSFKILRNISIAVFTSVTSYLKKNKTSNSQLSMYICRKFNRLFACYGISLCKQSAAKYWAIQNAVQQYEQSGNYAKALETARSGYEESVKLKLSEAASFSKSINRLEQKLLSLGCSRLLFDENDQPRAKLLQLLEVLGMESLNKTEKPILQINRWAQKNLLRRGVERWQQGISMFEPLKQKIKPLLCELGFLDTSSAHFDEYQGAIVHGALLSTVRLRLRYLVEQWKQGVRFKHLYFLSGERPLEEREIQALAGHSENVYLKIRSDWSMPSVLPKTEREMMQVVWEQSEIPETMLKEVQVCFINASMKRDSKNENPQRPTTEDTVKYWLQEKPPYGRYLAITNAPYINRQDLVIRLLAPNGYGFDTIGPKAGEQEKLANFLDELAQYIFQLIQLNKVKREICSE